MIENFLFIFFIVGVSLYLFRNKRIGIDSFIWDVILYLNYKSEYILRVVEGIFNFYLLLKFEYDIIFYVGELILIRLFLSGYELILIMRDINKKFLVRYYFNLVLVDEEERRYFK